MTEASAAVPRALSYLNNMDYGIVIFLGSGKTFKSGTMYSLLDYLPKWKARRKAFYNFPAELGGMFPPYIGAYNVSDLWDIEPGSIAVLEDANRLFSSRGSGKDSDVQAWTGIISHKSILALLTVQNTANMDACFFRDQDSVIIHKRMSPDGIRYERPEFQSSAEWANVIIDDISSSYGVDWHLVSYVPRFGEALVLDKIVPSWYGWKQSHALRDYRPDPSMSRRRASS